jgi:hypothetical protein
MLAVFALRLALGMLTSLFLLSPKQMHPRFFRTHFLTALGLLVVAFIADFDRADWHDQEQRREQLLNLLVLAAAVLVLLGTVLWVFERTTIGWAVLVLAVGLLVFSLWIRRPPREAELPAQYIRTTDLGEGSGTLCILVHRNRWKPAIDHYTSALLLGFAVTAMLVGHSYLISPGLSIRPLIWQIGALFVAIGLRALVAGTALWLWTAEHSLTNLNDETVLWLLPRWLVGLLGPAFFGFLAFRTARIRSTQSATGILYVVVIMAFLGELNALLLLRITGLPL